MEVSVEENKYVEYLYEYRILLSFNIICLNVKKVRHSQAIHDRYEYITYARARRERERIYICIHFVCEMRRDEFTLNYIFLYNLIIKFVSFVQQAISSDFCL